jgi:hypothetical protein
MRLLGVVLLIGCGAGQTTEPPGAQLKLYDCSENIQGTRCPYSTQNLGRFCEASLNEAYGNVGNRPRCPTDCICSVKCVFVASSCR